MEHQTLSQKLGQEAFKLRKALGLTQSQVCDKASALLPEDSRIYQTDLSSFEKRGEKLTSLEKIGAVFSVLGKDLGITEKKTLSMSAKSIKPRSEKSPIC